MMHHQVFDSLHRNLAEWSDSTSTLTAPSSPTLHHTKSFFSRSLMQTIVLILQLLMVVGAVVVLGQSTQGVAQLAEGFVFHEWPVQFLDVVVEHGVPPPLVNMVYLVLRALWRWILLTK
jgi:hypothetical protein